MGNFEKLSVLVIVVIIVMILVVAIYTWSDSPDAAKESASSVSGNNALLDPRDSSQPGRGQQQNPWDMFDDPPKTPVEPQPSEPRPSEPQPVEPQPPVDPQPVDPPSGSTPVDPAANEPWLYTVQSGDTISQIAEKHLGKWRRMKEILALNSGLTPENLRVGAAIKMPPRGMTSSTEDRPGADGPGDARSGPAIVRAGGPIKVGEWYVTKRGDTLERISKMAYRSLDYWPELWARNLSTISDPQDIPEGTRIFIVEVARR